MYYVVVVEYISIHCMSHTCLFKVNSILFAVYKCQLPADTMLLDHGNVICIVNHLN